MTRIAIDTIALYNATVRPRIAYELQLCCRRFEALSSPPRHLRIPIVGDLEAVRQVACRAAQRGDLTLGEDLQYQMVAEIHRRQLLSAWPGRSYDAWNALHMRFWDARQDALHIGLLDRDTDSYRFITDRMREVEALAGLARRREAQGLPAYA